MTISIGTQIDRAGKMLAVSRADLLHATSTARRLAARAASEGMSEVEIAKRLKVDRGTVRKWLGKDAR